VDHGRGRARYVWKLAVGFNWLPATWDTWEMDNMGYGDMGIYETWGYMKHRILEPFRTWYLLSSYYYLSLYLYLRGG